jgi:hypothetical protein
MYLTKCPFSAETDYAENVLLKKYSLLKIKIKIISLILDSTAVNSHECQSALTPPTLFAAIAAGHEHRLQSTELKHTSG